jgi:hypothetical protein
MSVDISQSLKESILEQLSNIYHLKFIEWTKSSDNIYFIVCSFEEKIMKLKLHFSDFSTVNKIYFYVFFDGCYDDFLHFPHVYSAINDFNFEFKKLSDSSNSFSLHNGNLFLLVEGYSKVDSDLYHLVKFDNHTENTILRLRSNMRYSSILVNVEINWHSFNIAVSNKLTGILFKDSIYLNNQSYGKIKDYLLKIVFYEIIFKHNLINDFSIDDIKNISFEDHDNVDNFMSLLKIIEI